MNRPKRPTTQLMKLREILPNNNLEQNQKIQKY